MSLETTLGIFIQRSHYSMGQLASLSGVPKRTIANWLGGRVQKPHQWQGLVAIAKALHLSDEETTQLLQSAGHKTLSQLLASANSETRALLATWEATMPLSPMLRPQRLATFTGRENELNWLTTHLKPGRILTICATGGMGKTALATQLIWQIAPHTTPPPQFPDGIFFYSFYNQPNTLIALSTLAHTFGQDPTLSPPPIAANLALTNKRALLIWDGAEEADNLPAILQVGSNCAILVTTRRRSDAPGKRLDLNALHPADAIALLRQISKQPNLPATLAQTLCDFVGHLPLAIHLIGHHIQSHDTDPVHFAIWLQATPLEALNHGHRRSQSIPLLLNKTIQQLDQPTRRQLALLGCLALQPFPPNWFKKPQYLGKLINWGLLITTNNHKQLRHPLIHHYTTTHLTPTPTELSQFVTRILNQTTAANFIELRPHLIALCTALQAQSLWDTLIQLIETTDTFMVKASYWHERHTLLTIATHAAQQQTDTQRQIHLNEQLGDTAIRTDQLEKALQAFKQAFEIAQQTKSYHHMARLYGQMGRASWRLDELNEARKYYEQAHSLAITLNDPMLQLQQQFGLARSFMDLAQFEASKTLASRTLPLSRQLDDSITEANILSLLGSIEYHTGTMEKAKELAQSAVEAVHITQDKHNLIGFLNRLGHYCLMLGDYEANHSHQNEALSLARTIRWRTGEVSALINLGHNQLYQEQFKPALYYYEQAYQLVKQISVPLGQNTLRGMLSYTHAKLGEGTKALSYAQHMVNYAYTTKSEREIGRSLHHLALAQMVAGQLNHALESQIKSLEIIQRHKIERLIGHCFALLAELYEKKEDDEQAKICYDKAFQSLSETQQRPAEMWCGMRFAEFLQRIGQPEHAKVVYTRCQHLARELNHLSRAKKCEQALRQLSQVQPS